MTIELFQKWIIKIVNKLQRHEQVDYNPSILQWSNITFSISYFFFFRYLPIGESNDLKLVVGRRSTGEPIHISVYRETSSKVEKTHFILFDREHFKYILFAHH